MCDLVLIFLWCLFYGYSIGCVLLMNNVLLLIYYDFFSFYVIYGKNIFMYVCMKRLYKLSIVLFFGFFLLVLFGVDM